MRTVWKYELTPPSSVDNVLSIEMPAGAKILRIATQHAKGSSLPGSIHGPVETPCLWADVNPEGHPTRRSFLIVGTGAPIHHPSHPDRRYVGSFSLTGPLEFHVFELLRDEPF